MFLYDSAGEAHACIGWLENRDEVCFAIIDADGTCTWTSPSR